MALNHEAAAVSQCETITPDPGSPPPVAMSILLFEQTEKAHHSPTDRCFLLDWLLNASFFCRFKAQRADLWLRLRGRDDPGSDGEDEAIKCLESKVTENSPEKAEKFPLCMALEWWWEQKSITHRLKAPEM